MAKKRLQKKKAAARTEAERIKIVSTAPQVSAPQIKIETKKTEPVKVETKKTEPIKVSTSKIEPVKVETKKTEPIKVSTSKTEPVKVETKKTERIKVSTSKAEPVKVETKKTEPIKVSTSKIEPVKVEKKRQNPQKSSSWQRDDAVYQARLMHHMDELKWLYCELYQDDPLVMEHLSQLLKGLKTFYDTRTAELKASDLSREKDPHWYKRNDLTGMMMYVNSFAKTLRPGKQT